jgi:DNA mismatch endonuclease, patch repair protein
MVDRLSREQRSSLMGAVRGKNTTPEMAVRKAAHGLGLRFRLHNRGLVGTPDLTFPKSRTVVFVNGCFWHRHPGCKLATMPKSNIDFWTCKFETTTRRDLENYAKLETEGWRVVILWQCEVKSLDLAIATLKSAFA